MEVGFHHSQWANGVVGDAGHEWVRKGGWVRGAQGVGVCGRRRPQGPQGGAPGTRRGSPARLDTPCGHAVCLALDTPVTQPPATLSDVGTSNL